MSDYVPVHENLQKFFKNVDQDLEDHNLSVQILRSKFLLAEGYLCKKVLRRRDKWQRRYAILLGHYLFYFENEESKKPRNWFSLRAYNKVSEESGDDPKKKFIVKIANTMNSYTRDYWFQMATVEEFQMWTASLQAVLDYNHNPGFIQKRCHEHLLRIKEIPDTTPDTPGTPDHSSLLNCVVLEGDCSRLSRSLGLGWKSFSREKLCIPQLQLDIIQEKHNKREDVIYTVLLLWRQREGKLATKRRLIQLLEEFADEISHEEWECLLEKPLHV